MMIQGYIQGQKVNFKVKCQMQMQKCVIWFWLENLFSCISEVIQGQKSISNEQKAKMWFKKKIGASMLFWLDKHFW